MFGERRIRMDVDLGPESYVFFPDIVQGSTFMFSEKVPPYLTV